MSLAFKRIFKFFSGQIDLVRIQDPQRRHHVEVRRDRRRPHRRRRRQQDLHPLHLPSQQDRSDIYRGEISA